MNRESTPKTSAQKKRSLGLLKRREVLLPTFRGWVIIGFSFVILAILAGRHIHSFLTVNDSLPGGALVVVDETTDESSVGNFEAFALADADGEGEAAAIGEGSGDSGAASFG